MPLTFDEITQREERLRREIAERERMLAAYQLLRADTVNHQSWELSEAPIVAAVAPPATGASNVRPPESSYAPAPINPPAPLARKINPVLAALQLKHGGNGRAVWWAIKQMTGDYTLRDIRALLEREGCQMPHAEISVVLTRLKQRGEIEEIRPGGGRTPAVYRKPDNTATEHATTAEPAGGMEIETKNIAAE
jgi:hypothetical protein